MKITALLFLLLSIAFCQSVQAQDKLLLRNGDEMRVKVLEITPDSLIFTKIPDSAAVKPESMAKGAVFSITYQNGKKEVMSEAKPVPAPLSEGALYAKGRAEAKKSYKAGGVFWATFATTVAVPLGGPMLGIPTGAVLTAINVPDKKIIASDPAFKQSPNYLSGYQKQAKQKKLGNAAAGFGVGTGVIAGIALLALSSMK